MVMVELRPVWLLQHCRQHAAQHGMTRLLLVSTAVVVLLHSV
jgi:hypothetical protein